MGIAPALKTLKQQIAECHEIINERNNYDRPGAEKLGTKREGDHKLP